jgi:hypothetical protein
MRLLLLLLLQVPVPVPVPVPVNNVVERPVSHSHTTAHTAAAAAVWCSATNCVQH